MLTASPTDVLSHVAIRARGQGVLLAACLDAERAGWWCGVCVQLLAACLSAKAAGRGLAFVCMYTLAACALTPKPSAGEEV